MPTCQQSPIHARDCPTCFVLTHTLAVTPAPTQPQIEHCHSGFTEETTEAGKGKQSRAEDLFFGSWHCALLMKSPQGVGTNYNLTRTQTVLFLLFEHNALRALCQSWQKKERVKNKYLVNVREILSHYMLNEVLKILSSEVFLSETHQREVFVVTGPWRWEVTVGWGAEINDNEGHSEKIICAFYATLPRNSLDLDASKITVKQNI